MNFGAPLRFKKGCVISLQNLLRESTFYLIQQKTKKVNKYFDIRRQFHNLTTCRNDMMHT